MLNYQSFRTSVKCGQNPRGKISILLKILYCKIETGKKKEKQKRKRGRKKNPKYKSLIL